MSLGNLMVRNLALMALRGRTLAKDEVRASLLMPLNDIKADQVVPVLAIYTDTAKAGAEDIEGRDFIGARATTTLAFEFACFTRAPVDKGVDSADTETVLGIPNTDEGMEMTLDIIQRQIFTVLQASDNSWSELFREFVLRGRGWEAERGASVEVGSKFAARRLEMMVQIIADPIVGRALPPAWDAAIAAFEANAPTAVFGSTLRKVAAGDPLPVWRTSQAELGLTRAGLRSIGIDPAVLTGLNTPVPVSELTADDLDRDMAVTVDG